MIRILYLILRLVLRVYTPQYLYNLLSIYYVLGKTNAISLFLSFSPFFPAVSEASKIDLSLVDQFNGYEALLDWQLAGSALHASKLVTCLLG